MEKINDNIEIPVNLNDPNCIFKIKKFYDGTFSFGQVDKKSELANGITILHFENGIYQGQCVKGKKEGFGRILYIDGSFYQGYWI